MRLLAIASICALLACSSNNGEAPEPDAGPDAAIGCTPPPPVAPTVRTFSSGPYGTSRHDIADDFSVELMDGTTWTLSENFPGDESYLFVPDTLRTSDADATSLWTRPLDLAQMIEESPKNVHYFFVSRLSGALATANLTFMATSIDELLATMSGDDAAHWGERLHVIATPAAAIDNWVAGVLVNGIGPLGFAIDRFQTLRGIGSLADVTRYDAALTWPWTSNLAYVAREPRRYNYEAARQDRLDAEDATVVTLWAGDVLAQFADMAVTLPSADEMANFDTFEIDITARCPNFEIIEAGNCGAWDYIANLFVYEEDSKTWTELGRFITTYHREGRFTVDATPMLVHLLSGGTRTFRWSFAPEWNTQPTATWLDLRFSNRCKSDKPAEATFLWTGGGFNSAYNTIHPDIEVPIPADAARVELWAIITGHGGATNNCAEFCNHQHEFTVNGNAYLHEHLAIGDDEGCVAEIENGAVPNQWGTWWFGRGGWCPGQQVPPYVVDVTSDVTPGESATLSYRGLFQDDTPPDNAGDIAMVSYLVVYRQADP